MAPASKNFINTFSLKYEKNIVSFLNKKISIFYLTFFCFFLAFFTWANLTNQTTLYGTNFGKLDDQADSYSEYIVRNTLVNDFIGNQNKKSTLIFTDGYTKTPLDFSYSESNTITYSHSRAIQRDFYFMLINLSPSNFINDKPIFNLEPRSLIGLASLIKSSLSHLNIRTSRDIYFQFFRFINCFLLSFCITVFFVNLFERKMMTLLLILLFSMVSGIALFSSNLFNCFWAMFTPLLCYSFIKKDSYLMYHFLLPLLFSYLYFSIHYLFAATFAILWLLPIFFDSKIKSKKNAIKFLLISLGIIFGFFLEVINHINYVSERLSLNTTQAFSDIFESTRTRVLSLEGVPFPFGIGFFKSMIIRLSWDGIRIPMFISISKMIFLITLLIFYKKNICNLRNLCLWAFLAYFSCYLFSYQHMMVHDMYDSLIFSVTIQLGVFLVLASYLKDKFYLKNN